MCRTIRGKVSIHARSNRKHERRPISLSGHVLVVREDDRSGLLRLACCQDRDEENDESNETAEEKYILAPGYRFGKQDRDC
jgi:hypothetical protein